MFSTDITITGKHAEYIKALGSKGYLIESDKNFSFYERYIDVLMNGVIVGLIFNNKEPKDNISQYKDAKANILAGVLINERTNLDYIFRLVMLLDESSKPVEEKINRAFRDDALKDKTNNHKENMEVFMSYCRGGITILYERLTENASTIEDYYENAINFMKEIDYDNISVGDADKLLDTLK